jgi:DNA-binding XRE family transcriptional regulator
MKTHTEYQTIDYNGHHAFVLVPWEQFNLVRPFLEHNNVLQDTIPHEVVKANIMNKVPMIKAWREYLGMTQEQLAEKVHMKQSALARLESGTGKPRTATLLKLATVFGIKPELLEE